ncbi:hypothetical protein IAU59_000001 [Kwoniella sp. CBS 9459]
MSTRLSPTRSSKSVLISGGSIAGPAIAWWLHRYGFKTTLVERWPELRPGGQNIDVSNQGRDIVRRMGIDATILAANTGEKGTIVTDTQGNTRISLPLGQGPSATNETEILRGEFANILYNITQDNTQWRFDDQISAMDEFDHDGEHPNGGVNVEFKSGRKESFDLVVIADGVGSRTRKLAFSEKDVKFKALGCYIAYFTIPLDPNEPRSDQWIVTPLPGRRMLSFRPDGQGTTKAFLMWITDGSQGYEKLGMSDQIAAIHQILVDGKAQSSPIVVRAAQGLKSTPDLYLEYTGQIKADRLSTAGGHIGMIGDAAYCGTAMSGAGTTLSLVGAYILAGELAKHQDDLKAGFEGYERWMKPFAEETQRLVPGVPHIVLPNTEWGIEVLIVAIRFIVWLITTRSMQWISSRLFRDKLAERPLPDYSQYEVKDEKK